MVRDSIIYLFTSALAQGVYFIITPMVIKELGREGYAETELFYTYSQIVLYVFGLNLYSSITRYKYEGASNNNFRLFYSTIYAHGLAATLLLFLIICILRYQLVEWMNIPSRMLILLPLSFYSIYTYSVVQNFFVVEKRVIRFAITQAILASLKVFVIAVFFYALARTSAYDKILAEYTTFAIIITIIAVGAVSISFDYQRFREFYTWALTFSGPLFLYVIGSNILNFSDQWIIGEMLGKDRLGVYSLSFRYSFILIIFYTAISNSFTIKYFDKIDDKYESKKNILTLQVLLFSVSIIIVFSKSFVLSLLSGWSSEILRESYNLVELLVLSNFVYTYYLIVSRLLFYLKKTMLLSILMMVGAILNIILNLWVIEKHDITAAAVTTLVSAGLITILTHFKIKWSNDLRNFVRPNIYVHLIFTLVLAGLCFLF